MTGHKDKSRHHHGDLRSALIDAGVALLREGGLAALTLRKCAARAGVSHAAPAHHFDGIDGLRAAIAAEGFLRFERYMREAIAQGQQTPSDRMHSMCHGYLAFAREEPALYDLIFSFRPNSPHMQQTDVEAGPAYGVLRETCAPFVPAGTDPRVIETQVWALVHGLAMLTLSGRFGEGPQPDKAVLGLLDHIGQDPAAG